MAGVMAAVGACALAAAAALLAGAGSGSRSLADSSGPVLSGTSSSGAGAGATATLALVTRHMGTPQESGGALSHHPDGGPSTATLPEPGQVARPSAGVSAATGPAVNRSPGAPTGPAATHHLISASSPAPTEAELVAGAGPIPAGWVARAHTVNAGGLTRFYLTIEPAKIRGSLPVVLLMHGRGMTPDTVLRISGLADQIGPALLVVPAGWDRSWNAGDCCGAAYRAGVNDVAFLRTAVTDVLATDPAGRQAKVYAVGFSNGGRLAYLLACQMPGVFTGFVAVEAVPVEACTPPRPLDMTIVAQQSDPLLTVGHGQPKVIGGFTEPTVAATVNRMESADHCRTQPAAADFGLAVERAWTCAGGTSVRYVWYPSGGHTWRPAAGGTPGATDFVLQMLGKWNPAHHSGGPEAGMTLAGGASGS